jgi:hypothetical protein
MPAAKEFTIFVEDRPGQVAKLARALADRGINILAFQAFPSGGKSVTRIVVDNPATAKAALSAGGYNYTEAEVAQVALPHRPGQLARAASRLGDANINIDYAYVGLEPGTNRTLVIFGTADNQQAITILDQLGAAAAGS